MNPKQNTQMKVVQIPTGKPKRGIHIDALKIAEKILRDGIEIDPNVFGYWTFDEEKQCNPQDEEWAERQYAIFDELRQPIARGYRKELLEELDITVGNRMGTYGDFQWTVGFITGLKIAGMADEAIRGVARVLRALVERTDADQ